MNNNVLSTYIIVRIGLSLKFGAIKWGCSRIEEGDQTKDDVLSIKLQVYHCQVCMYWLNEMCKFNFFPNPDFYAGF